MLHLIRSNDLPVSLIGLPTSDLYMMGRPGEGEHAAVDRPRGTLQIAHLIDKYDLKCAISINNVGNAFTPHGSCDPLQIASMGMLVYQAATTRHCWSLYDAVSTRAKSAIGIASGSLRVKVGDPANLVLFGDPGQGRCPFDAADVIYDLETTRTVIYEGRLVAEHRATAQLFIE